MISPLLMQKWGEALHFPRQIRRHRKLCATNIPAHFLSLVDNATNYGPEMAILSPSVWHPIRNLSAVINKIRWTRLLNNKNTSATGQRCVRAVSRRVLNLVLNMWHMCRDRWTKRQMKWQGSKRGSYNGLSIIYFSVRSHHGQKHPWNATLGQV